MAWTYVISSKNNTAASTNLSNAISAFMARQDVLYGYGQDFRGEEVTVTERYATHNSVDGPIDEDLKITFTVEGDFNSFLDQWCWFPSKFPSEDAIRKMLADAKMERNLILGA